MRSVHLPWVWQLLQLQVALQHQHTGQEVPGTLALKLVPWQQHFLDKSAQGSHAAGAEVKGPPSDLKTSALLASTKSSRSNTKGLGREGAFSQLSMPSLAASGSRLGQSARWHNHHSQQSNICPGGRPLACI